MAFLFYIISLMNDSINIFEFSSRIQSQLEYMEIGMGEHVTKNVVSLFTAIASLIFGFFGSWKLALVLLCITPIIIVVGIYLNYLNVKGNTLMRQTWESAGGIAGRAAGTDRCRECAQGRRSKAC